MVNSSVMVLLQMDAIGGQASKLFIKGNRSIISAFIREISISIYFLLNIYTVDIHFKPKSKLTILLKKNKY